MSYVCIYIYRERDMYVCVYIYIYIYIAIYKLTALAGPAGDRTGATK